MIHNYRFCWIFLFGTLSVSFLHLYFLSQFYFILKRHRTVVGSILIYDYNREIKWKWEIDLTFKKLLNMNIYSRLDLSIMNTYGTWTYTWNKNLSNEFVKLWEGNRYPEKEDFKIMSRMKITFYITFFIFRKLKSEGNIDSFIRCLMFFMTHRNMSNVYHVSAICFHNSTVCEIKNFIYNIFHNMIMYLIIHNFINIIYSII